MFFTVGLAVGTLLFFTFTIGALILSFYVVRIIFKVFSKRKEARFRKYKIVVRK